MSKEEIAKELTLAIVDRLKVTDSHSREAMNKSLATEVAHAYLIIYQAVQASESIETENFHEIASKIRGVFN